MFFFSNVCFLHILDKDTKNYHINNYPINVFFGKK